MAVEGHNGHAGIRLRASSDVFADKTGMDSSSVTGEKALAARKSDAPPDGILVPPAPWSDDNLRVALEQKCIWDEESNEWVSPNQKTLENLFAYVKQIASNPHWVSAAEFAAVRTSSATLVNDFIKLDHLLQRMRAILASKSEDENKRLIK